MSINLVMPSLGESVIEGTITKWLVNEGDVVAREQVVVSVATDKADSDVPAPQGGRIVKILAPEGATAWSRIVPSSPQERTALPCGANTTPWMPPV